MTNSAADRTSCLVFMLAIWLSTALIPGLFSHAQDIKRGWAGSNADQANAVNARWVYNWGYVPPAGIHGEYVPMFWGPFNVQLRLNAILTYEDVQYVLGFNEPERPDQANMSVETAIEFWTEICAGLDGTGIKLVSPAVSDTVDGRAWLDDFMQQAEANNLVVDEVAFHWYGFVNPANPTGSAISFLNKVDQYHNNYGRNVWVTEFAGVDFAGQFTDEQMQQANAAFMSVAIPGLESRTHVTRYSMWAFNNDCEPIVAGDCDNWKPTIVGENYFRVNVSGEVIELNESSISTDTVYLRGARVENNGQDMIENGVKDIYALSNPDGTLLASTLGGTTDWSVSESAIITVEENATLRKTGLCEISWPDATICNHGLIRIFESDSGTLWIHGPQTTGSGTGEIRLDATNCLRLGQLGDESGFSLPFDIQCRGGVVKITGDDIQLDGNLTIFAQTMFDVEGSLNLTGQLLQTVQGGGSGIVKSGSGSLTIAGTNTFPGSTIVNQGQLTINGSITNDLILNQGIVRGVGDVNGDALIAGTLKPGNNVGVFQAATCEFAPGGALELDLGPFGAVDSLSVQGPLIIGDNTTLRFVLADGYSPAIGAIFDVIDSSINVGQFTHFDLPVLEQGEWDFELFNQFGIVRVVESEVFIGDINLDGQVNLLDIDPFITLIEQNQFQTEADINQDGLVNLLDVMPFVALLSSG